MIGYTSLTIRIISSYVILFGFTWMSTIVKFELKNQTIDLILLLTNALLVFPLVDISLLSAKKTTWWKQSSKTLIIFIICLGISTYLPIENKLIKTMEFNYEIQLALIYSFIPISFFTLINEPLKQRKPRTLIFLCYRRLDDENLAIGRIHDYLCLNFSSKKIFKDIKDVEAADDFRKITKQNIRESKIFLVIIGKLWLENKDLNTELTDEVFYEINLALNKFNKKIIPVYIGETEQVTKNALPENLKKIADLHSRRIRTGNDFENDMKILVDDIKSKI